MLAQQRSAIVIGAGIVGIATAHALVRDGWKVQLVERETSSAQGASCGNGAQLSYCFTDALASPAILASALSILFKDEGINITPQYNLAFAGWFAVFLRNCTRRQFERNTLEALALARESKAAMAALLTQHDIAFAHRAAGKMHLYSTEAALRRANHVRLLKAPFGCEQTIFSGAEAAAIDPALESAAGSLAGAIYTPSEEVGDSSRFCAGVLSVLQQHFGVTTNFGSAVTALDLTDKTARIALDSGEEMEADLAVLCTGAATNTLLRLHGLSLPIQPMKGYSFEMPLADGSPTVSITDTARKIVFTNLGDRMRVAGVADLGNGNPAVDAAVSACLVAAARSSLPDAGVYDLAGKHWAGLRPMTPNSLPIISRPRQSLAINAGHGMLGWTLAMGSGERLACLVR